MTLPPIFSFSSGIFSKFFWEFPWMNCLKDSIVALIQELFMKSGKYKAILFIWKFVGLYDFNFANYLFSFNFISQIWHFPQLPEEHGPAKFGFNDDPCDRKRNNFLCESLLEWTDVFEGVWKNFANLHHFKNYTMIYLIWPLF